MKSKFYKFFIRSHITYGLDVWSLNKKNKIKVKITEIGMLRWTYGVTRLDRVRNKCIKGSLGVTNIAEKMRENKLNWFELLKGRMLKAKIKKKKRKFVFFTLDRWKFNCDPKVCYLICNIQ